MDWKSNIRNKSMYLVIIAIVVIGLGSLFSDKIENPVTSYTPKITTVKFNDELYVNVETAATTFERGKGLMYRESLGENNGMLFVYTEPTANKFWMKNMLIPLDMIFINSEYEIIYIVEDAQPCEADPCEKYGPDSEYSYVLEVNAGWVAAHDTVSLDDKLVFYLPD